MKNLINSATVYDQMEQEIENKGYPYLSKFTDLKIDITDFEVVEKNDTIKINLFELDNNNYTATVTGNKLIISVAVSKQYRIPDSKSTDPLKSETTYYIMKRAEIALPGNLYSLQGTSSIPAEKKLEIFLKEID